MTVHQYIGGPVSKPNPPSLLLSSYLFSSSSLARPMITCDNLCPQVKKVLSFNTLTRKDSLRFEGCHSFHRSVSYVVHTIILVVLCNLSVEHRAQVEVSSASQLHKTLGQVWQPSREQMALWHIWRFPRPTHQMSKGKSIQLQYFSRCSSIKFQSNDNIKMTFTKSGNSKSLSKFSSI